MEDMENFFFNRLIELRMKKGVSARDMSLSIGQNSSYINGIENKKSFPSMIAFFYICDYFGITPMEFFNTDNSAPLEIAKITEQLYLLDKIELEHLSLIIGDLAKTKTSPNSD